MGCRRTVFGAEDKWDEFKMSEPLTNGWCSYRFWDFCFIWFMCEPIYVALFSLNIHRPFWPPCRAFLNLWTSRFFRSQNLRVFPSISEAKWHRWIGRPKSDTFVSLGTIQQALGSNEWESTPCQVHHDVQVLWSQIYGKMQQVWQNSGKKGCFQCSWKRFQQIPQTIFSPVFFLIPRILSVKVFIASKWLRLPVDSATFWRSFVEDPSNDVWVPRNRYRSESKNFQRQSDPVRILYFIRFFSSMFTCRGFLFGKNRLRKN